MSSNKNELNKSLGLLETIAVGVSDISPVTGLFVMFPVLIATSGTASIPVMLIAGMIALAVALAMGQLGSMYPDAGGLYAIIRRILGKPVGFVSLILYLGQGVFVPAVVALGAATYITNIFPALNLNLVAMVVIIFASSVAIINIAASAKFTAVLLILELGVVGIFTIAAFLSMEQSPAVLFEMEVLNSAKELTKVPPLTIFAAVAVMLFAYNGFDSALTLSEESSSGDQKDIGKSVFRSALVGVSAQIIPAIALILAAPSIVDLLSAKDPLVYVGTSVLGPKVDLLLNVGAAVAMIACTIAVILQFSRVLFASGRNNAWPKFISKAFSTLHPKFKTPWVGVLVLGILGAILVLQSNLEDLVTFTSVIIVILYALMGISLIVSHTKKYENVNRPYKIPLWPVIAFISVVGPLAALTQQSGIDLLIVFSIIVISILYYVFYLRKKESLLS